MVSVAVNAAGVMGTGQKNSIVNNMQNAIKDNKTPLILLEANKMGNWRTVSIKGTCDSSEAEALKEACTYGDSFENFHCLAFNPLRPSLMGLNGWIEKDINAIGNLAERGYSVDDVAEQLKKLVLVAPSLDLKVHCGDDWESKTCINTITVKDGEVQVGPAEIDELEEIPGDQITLAFLRNIH